MATMLLLVLFISLCKLIGAQQGENILVGFNATTYTVNEGERVMLALVLNTTASSQITFDVITEDDSARAPGDYEPINSTVSIPAGGTEYIISLLIKADNITEDSESFTLRLLNPSDGVTLGDSMATVNIVDLDVALVVFNPIEYTVVEDPVDINFIVELVTPTERQLTITLNISPGSAQAAQPEDYQSFGMIGVTFSANTAAGESTTAPVRISDDTNFEPTEYFTASIVPNPAQRIDTIEGRGTATAFIIDDDSITFGFDQTMYSVMESTSSVAITVSLMNGMLDSNITEVIITLTTEKGTATSSGESDFMPQTVNLTFTVHDAQQSQTVVIGIMDDSYLETNEQFNCTLTLAGTYDPSVQVAPALATVTIIDDDSIVIGFNQTLYEVNENEPVALTFVIITSGILRREVAINVSTQDDTALGGSDYTPLVQQQLLFDGSISEISVAITITDDSQFERIEQFIVRLSMGDPSVILNPSDTVVRILSDDVVTVGFRQRQYTFLEGVGVAEVCVDRNGSIAIPVSVTVSGTIQTEVVNKILSFSDSDSSICINFTINDDNIALQAPQEYNLLLSPEDPQLQVERNSTRIIIMNDDVVIVGFNPTEYNISESAGVVTLMIERRGATAQPLMVNVSTNDSSNTDYETTMTAVIFSPSLEEVITVPFNISIIDDTAVESNEQFEVILSTSQEAVLVEREASLATVNITDDDNVVIGFNQTLYEVSESEQQALISVILLDGILQREATVTVSVTENTAIGGQDFNPFQPQALTFNVGTSYNTLAIDITNDDIFEMDEQFHVALSTMDMAIILSPAQTTIRILNDDVVKIGFRQQTYTALESAENALICVDKNGTTDLSINVTINGSIQAEAIDRVLTFPPSNISSVCININITDDAVALELPEEYSLELMKPDNPQLQLQINLTRITIVDDDVVTVGFNPTEYNVSEGDGMVMLTVERRGATAQPVMVNITTDNLTSTELIFPSSLEETVSLEFNITIVDDTIVESTEQIELYLNTSQEGVVIGADTDVAVVNIFNDDSFVLDIGFQMAEYTTSESSGSLTVVIVLSGSIATPFSVSIQGVDGTAIDLSDYAVISTPIMITPGRTSVPVTVAVYDIDSTFDADGFKNFSLVLSTNENAARITTDTTVVIIFDNDFLPPAVDITTPASVQDGEPVIFGCTVNASLANITVFWLDETGDIIGNGGPEYFVNETREFVTQNSFRVVSTLTVASFSVLDNLCNPFSCVGIVGNPVVQYSTMANVTNLQLQLPPIDVNQLVYSRIGDLLTLSCLPSENSTTVVWFTVDDINGIEAITECSSSDFSLIPPGLITFNAAQYILDNFGRGHSLTETSFHIVCTFSSGGNTSGIDSSVNITILLQQERIRMALASSPDPSRSNNSITNNTIINSGFTSLQREGSSSDSGTMVSSGDDLSMGSASSPLLTIDCTAAQGDHMPYWITPDKDSNQVLLFVDDYTTSLEFYDVRMEGNYTCISNLSSELKKFLLTPDNPYLRSVSPREVTVMAGESVALEFSVAVDSNGLIWSRDRVNFTFNSTLGEESVVNFTVADENFPHHFIYMIESVNRSHAGVYTASASTQLCPTGDCYEEVSITVTVITYCPEEFNGGIFWPRTRSDSQVSFSCGSADLLFEGETMTARQCDADGVWSKLDLTTCTLTEMNLTFILTWFVLEEEGGLPPERVNRTELEGEILRLFSDQNIRFESISLRLNDSLNDTAVTVEVILPSANQSEQVISLLDHFSSNITMLGSYTLRQQSQGYTVIEGSSSCACNQTESELTLCSGSTISPCDCSITLDCKCQPPFVGNGVWCTMDSDGDDYPDKPLESFICKEPDEASMKYCKADNCPTIPNLDQDPDDCLQCPGPGFTGCCSETDIWGITWPNRQPSMLAEQTCPGMAIATRLCDANGQWGPSNVLGCTSPEFSRLINLATNLRALSPEMQIIEAAELTKRLIVATEPLQSNNSLLPNDLGASVTVVDVIIEVLENNNSTNETIIEIFNNVLDDRNREGWRVLQSAGLTNNSELLLSSAERYAIVTAMSVNMSESGEQRNQTVRQSRTNIVILGEQYREAPSIDLQFPLPDDLVNYTSSKNSTTITIPSTLIKERLEEAANDNIPVFFVLLRNLPMGIFIVDESSRTINPCIGQNTSTLGASDVIASQVGLGSNNISFSSSLQESPIRLNFSFDSSRNPNSIPDSYRCVFWNFSDPVGDGSWETEGVTTNENFGSDGVTTTVRCSSTHLTSFAVLVDVAGGLMEIGKAERVALQVVSYVGCGISIIFLAITVLFFLWQGYHQRRLPDTKRVKSVQNFIHLNLSISLLLAFTVYVLGIETADENIEGCTFVAVVLHYFFLCAFCWMLCEGILLYLLLRVVFSEMAKMWWPFLLIGYVTPLPIVIVTVGARHEYYGVKDECGGVLYCWLSIEKGTIFGFVAPMLAIILLNVFFLVMALVTLASARKRQIQRQRSSTFRARQELGRALLVATLVLLPLLGLTWAFGILTINANSTAFAWLFTIFNSLQGLFIFIFHVIRSDKIWGKLSPKLQILKSKVISATGSKMENTSTGGTASTLISKGKPAGTSTQDAYSTLGRPERQKKEALVSSSVNDSLVSPTRSNYELKSDSHTASEFTATEAETKIDLGSTEKSNDPDPAMSDSIVMPKDEAEATSQQENTAIEENDKLKLNSNVDRADKNVPSGGDTSENCGEINASVIENPSASEEGKEQMDADIPEENTADNSCEVIENLKTTTEEIPKLNRNGRDMIVDEKVTVL